MYMWVSRSWTLEDLTDFCVWKPNCWNILWLLDFSMFVFQGSSVEVVPECEHWSYKGIWEESIGEYQRGKEEFLLWTTGKGRVKENTFKWVSVQWKTKTNGSKLLGYTGLEGLGTCLFISSRINKGEGQGKKGVTQIHDEHTSQSKAKIFDKFFVYYESIKREVKTKLTYECRCDERLQTTRLSCTVLHDRKN